MSKDFDENDDDLADKIEERRPRRKKRKRWSSNAKWGVALLVELIVRDDYD